MSTTASANALLEASTACTAPAASLASTTFMPRCAEELRHDAEVRRVVVHDERGEAGELFDGGEHMRRDRPMAFRERHRELERAALSGVLSTQIDRPSAPRAAREMVRPSPVPPNLRVVEPSACVNAWKMAACLSAAIADAGVDARVKCRPTRLGRARSRRTRTIDFAALGELDRVADQVDQDLPQAIGIADETHPARPASRRSSARGASRGRGAQAA